MRDGAPFADWQLSKPMLKVKDHYLSTKGGDRDFVDLLMLVQDHNIEIVEMACELAVEQKTLRLAAIINLINQLVEPSIEQLPQTACYPQLQIVPLADCKCYEQLTQLEVRV